MIHTYRDPNVFESKPLPFVVPLAVFAALSAFALSHGFTWNDRGKGAAAIALLLGLAYLNGRRYRFTSCREIRLSDDGICELETKRRVIRLHVNQISSVEYDRESDSPTEYCICYHPGGTVPVTTGMTDFDDFLIRLKSLNPAVDLTSFPAKDWPDLHTPATAGGETDIGRLIRTALLPTGVIALIIWLAIQTLGA
jgi:hypothetical protein